jgi:oxygen-independent coproporphyrinogen-3 oxidase
VRWARQAGFDNLNLDLIFGLPYQTLEAWERTLDRVLSLRPEHFSLYALTLEHGTPMQNWVMRGLLPELDSDLAADMYETASERLEEAGYIQYEISNWALKKSPDGIYACQHNLQYWWNQPYFGLGAGAHGYTIFKDKGEGRIDQDGPRGVRTANVLAPAAYIQRCLNGAPQPFPCTPATVETTFIRREDEIGETLMMGLRLVQEGISRLAFSERFGEELDRRFEKEINKLTAQGLLEWGGERLRLTKKGRLLGNQVFIHFI